MEEAWGDRSDARFALELPVGGRERSVRIRLRPSYC